MKGFYGEDRRQEYRLKNLQDKHEQICKIITAIEDTPRHQKANAVRSYSEQMQRLEQEVILCTKEITEQSNKCR